MKRGCQHRVDHRRGVDEEGDPSTEGGGGGGCGLDVWVWPGQRPQHNKLS